MNTAALVLLIIVSSVLSVFLVFLIVALGYFISVLKQVKRITARAESVADTVESAASAFERASSPIAVIKLIGKIVEQTAGFKKKG
ncbi:MAG TPA: hypothetical protein VFT49_00845 [Candidatus Saccharimonadales bacterium]|nr:hypothetical protein [Candidatus Saccharimonadales bacterium]